MIDFKDMKNLSLGDLFQDENIDDKKLDLVLRALESKLLDIPDRLKVANNQVDFSSGRYQEIMIDVDSMTTEMYELVSMLRECLPVTRK